MRGYSLIELLVAVLVMGVGVLGATALGALSLQQARGAMAHAQAVLLADDLLQRVRANPAGAAAAAYAFGGGASTAPNCLAKSCTAEQMAAFDLAVWSCRLGVGGAEAGCPSQVNGTAQVMPAAGSVRIRLQWQQGRTVRTLAVDG